jgi:hypothetical protein
MVVGIGSSGNLVSCLWIGRKAAGCLDRVSVVESGAGVGIPADFVISSVVALGSMMCEGVSADAVVDSAGSKNRRGIPADVIFVPTTFGRTVDVVNPLAMGVIGSRGVKHG